MKSNLLVVLILVKYATSNGGSGTLDNSYENLDMIEKLALRSIGYLKRPEDWHQAFVKLAKHYKEDIKRYINGSHMNEARYKEGMEQCKNESCVDEALCKEENKQFKNESHNINKRENMKQQLILKFCTQLLEDAEWYFNLEHIFPSKDEMFTDLLNNASMYSDTITRDCLMKIKNLTNYKCINEHTIKWLHFLAFSKGRLGTGLRNKLLERNIDAFEFCLLVGRILLCTRSVVYYSYSPIKDLNPEIVQEALINFGIEGSTVLEAVKVLLTIGNMTLIYRDNN